MVALWNKADHYIFALWFLSFYLLSSPNLSGRRLDVYHTSWCGLSANLECMSEMCCTRLAEKYRKQKWRNKSTSGQHRTSLSACIFATKARINNRKKLVKQKYLFHESPQYGELWPTSGWDRLMGLGHPSKFQRFSRLGIVTAATSLNGSQPNFARCFSLSWAGRLFIHFRRLLLVTEFCHVQNSCRILQVLQSPILTALLHGIRAVGASQTLRCWAHSATYIQQGDHHVGHWPIF